MQGLDVPPHGINQEVVDLECPFGNCPVSVCPADGKMRISCFHISYEESDAMCRKVSGVCRLRLCLENCS